MKDNQKREPLLEQLAKQYLDEDGRRLLEEAAKLEENAATPMPAVDGRVKSFRSARRRGRYVATFSAVAAGLLLLFLLPRLEVPTPASDASLSAPMAKSEATQAPVSGPAIIAESESPPEDAAMGGAAPQTPAAAAVGNAAPQAQQDADAYAEEAADTMEDAAPSAAAPSEEPVDRAPMQGGRSYDTSADMEMPAAPDATIIPLSFTLPADYTVDSVRQDRGETIYRLANAALDDVVLSVADAGTAPLSTGGLVEISGGAGDTAYGLSGADVQFITFEQDGLRYRLTCRHDIQTLLSLWQHIVAA